jgi:hypothetical protein
VSLPRAVLWKHLWSPAGDGLEHLVERARSVDSVVVWTGEDGQPCRLAYRVEWDARGCTRGLWAELAEPDGARRLELTADGSGSWRVDGRAMTSLDGCLDVDLWPTPFTNSLPIRRLELRTGEAAEIRVAWVAAPELEVSARAQRYARVGATSFRFESLDDGFAVELTVDEHGLVLLYPGLFRRIA